MSQDVYYRYHANHQPNSMIIVTKCTSRALRFPAESSFLPDLVFPFVKLFASAPGARSSAAMDERCFETIATLLACGWMRSWWERFPHPPLGLLTRLQVGVGPPIPPILSPGLQFAPAYLLASSVCSIRLF